MELEFISKKKMWQGTDGAMDQEKKIHQQKVLTQLSLRLYLNRLIHWT